MKKKLLLLLFVICFKQIDAQDYVPMAIEGAQWVVYADHKDPDGMPPFDYYPPFNDHYYGYRIEGDITYNGITYKKVYRRDFVPVYPDDTVYPVTGPFTIENEYLFGAIRDDIPNRKVYGIQFCNEDHPNYPLYCNCNEEILLFDFDMNVGDAIELNCKNDLLQGCHIGEIVYQYIVGETRQVQRIYGPSGFDTLSLRNFEGLGSDAGLFEYQCYFECNPRTYISNFCIGTDEECLQDYLATKEETWISKIKVYPNPTSNKLFIDLNTLKDVKIQLFTIFGKKLYSKKTNQNLVSIDVSNYDRGVYILKVNNKIKKIIKQ